MGGDEDDYSAMSYRDLQKLAKTAGVKANLPKAELIAALQKSAEEWISEDEEENAISSPPAAPPQEKMAEETTDVFNSTFEVDKETSILDRKFEIDDTPNKRRSTRLSIGTSNLLEKETKNSPKPAVASPGPASLAVSSRHTAGRRSTPKSLGKAKPRDLLKGVSSSSKKISGNPKSFTAKTTSLAKQVLTPKSSIKSVPKAVTPRSIVKQSDIARKVANSTSKATPATKKVGTPRTGVKPTPFASSKKISATNRATPSASAVKKSPATLKKPSGTNIPRFVKFARKAPDFTKLHEKQFKKMEGLDSYLEKVEKRSEVVKEQMAKANTLTEEHTKLVNQIKARTPGFVPSVTSTSKLNLNFGSTTTPGTRRRSKEPFKFSAAAATTAPIASTKKAKVDRTDLKTATKDKAKPKGRAQPKSTAVASTPKVEERTPMKPLLNLTNKSVAGTPASAKKFNLKASLAKPLGYKPHVGKLPSWGHQKKDVRDMRTVSAKEVIDRTRNIIKGVRMNKRAALLLQNRKIKE